MAARGRCVQRRRGGPSEGPGAKGNVSPALGIAQQLERETVGGDRVGHDLHTHVLE